MMSIPIFLTLLLFVFAFFLIRDEVRKQGELERIKSLMPWRKPDGDG